MPQRLMELPPPILDRFLAGHRLPVTFRRLADEHYLPLAEWIAHRRGAGNRPMLVGISGAQGTGKSTLADFLKLALEHELGWRVAVLSIDDFYRTKAGRRALALEIHPLIATRGPPGTHDMTMLEACLDEIGKLREGDSARLPRFDKARDDRMDASRWPAIDGPVDLVLLEGWCVGSVPQPFSELSTPVNTLEREEDPDRAWRAYVNECLATDYAAVFGRIDALIFLAAPDFDAVYRWRLEQESELAETAARGSPGIMTPDEIAHFIQFFERISRHNLRSLPDSADVIIELDENHGCEASRYPEQWRA